MRNIFLAVNDQATALATLDATIEEYRNEPIAMIDLLAAKLDLLQRIGSTEGAIAIADEVFEIIESQRMEFDTVRLGPYWSGRTNEIYTSHVDYLLRAWGRTDPLITLALSRPPNGRGRRAFAYGVARCCWQETRSIARPARNGSASFLKSKRRHNGGKPNATTWISNGASVRLERDISLHTESCRASIA